MNTFKNTKFNTYGLGFLMGGIIGNLADRLLFGYVKDFLNFYIIGYDYPVFNIADIFIVTGVIMLIISILKGEDVNGKRSECE
jgi:signal peptidase II